MSVTYKGYDLHEVDGKWTFTRGGKQPPTEIQWGDPCADSMEKAMEHIELVEAAQEGERAFYRERPNLSFPPNVMVPSSLRPNLAAQWLNGWMGGYYHEKARR